MTQSLFQRSLLVAVLSVGMMPAMAADIILSGSTTVQKRVLEPAAASITRATGLKVVVRGTSSGRGFKEILAGKTMASIASSPLAGLLTKNKLENDGTFQEHVITRDVIVPIVHKNNPVAELSFQQLSDINTGKITNWKDVGGPDMKIVVITSSKGSATRSVFQKMVMNKQSYVKRVREVKSTRKEIDLVAKFKGGIGAVSRGFVEANQGKVNIVKTDEISRPLSIITKGDPDSKLAKVIAYLKTDEAKQYFK